MSSFLFTHYKIKPFKIGLATGYPSQNVTTTVLEIRQGENRRSQNRTSKTSNWWVVLTQKKLKNVVFKWLEMLFLEV